MRFTQSEHLLRFANDRIKLSICRTRRTRLTYATVSLILCHRLINSDRDSMDTLSFVDFVISGYYDLLTSYLPNIRASNDIRWSQTLAHRHAYGFLRIVDFLLPFRRFFLDRNYHRDRMETETKLHLFAKLML